MSLALLSKEGEVTETDHYKQSKWRSSMEEGEDIKVVETNERRSYIKEGEGTSEGTEREKNCNLTIFFWHCLTILR